MKINSAVHHLAAIRKNLQTAVQHVAAEARHEVSRVAPKASAGAVAAAAIQRVVGKPAASAAHAVSHPAPAAPQRKAEAVRSAVKKALGTSSPQFLHLASQGSRQAATAANRVVDSSAVKALNRVGDKISKPVDFIDASAATAKALRASRFASTARGEAWTGLQHLEQRVSGALHVNKGTFGLIGKGAQFVAAPLSLASGVTGMRDGRNDWKTAASSGERFDAGLKVLGGAADVAAGALTIAGCVGVTACTTPVMIAAAGVLGAVSLGTEGVKDIHTGIRTRDLHTATIGSLELAGAVGIGAIALAL